MRVELRVETDEHEYEIVIACDQSVTVGNACYTAQQAMSRLMTSSASAVVMTEEAIR